ncbi:LrgB family protein, partial [Brachyspira sp. SAP_772]
IFRIKSPLAIGIAIGTASHAVGTSKAIEMGETEGAMSGLAIGIAGALTVILLPILYKLLVTIW